MFYLNFHLFLRNDEVQCVCHWPCRWAEWNGQYRDDIRRFIKVLRCA
jgi:hypothetical protein